MIRAVEAKDGRTLIADVDEAARSALRDQLYTAGELLRLNQLNPNYASPATSTQPRLFGDAK
jgi:hypothetical protein